jgi:Cd2+/Zn2+-exporting ATPase
VVPVDGLRSRRCERVIQRAVERSRGASALASYVAGEVRLLLPRDRCPLAEITDRLAQLGFRLRLGEATRFRAPASPDAAGVAPRRAALVPAVAGTLAHAPSLVLALLGGVLLAAGFLVHLAEGPLWARLALLTASAVCTSTQTGPEALRSLRQLRVDVDVLMFVAAGGAAFLGHYEEGALLLFLFGLGAAGEALALGRARSAITALSGVVPEIAHRLDAGGGQEDIPADEVVREDILVVMPFERIPADGQLTEGRSTVDQSAITGESTPVERGPGEPVFAGSMNGAGRFVMRAVRAADDTTLARVIRMVEQARTEKSPTQLVTDGIERWYVPAVLLATAGFITIPPLLGLGEWGTWFYRSMAFLTAASPCALAIGTPAAVLCGIARAARVGVLIKGGGPLEMLGRAEAVCFDKTGTLTLGRPVLTDVITLGRETEDEALALAAAVEAHTNHPLAAAVVAAAEQRGVDLPEAREVRQVTGSSVTGSVGAATVRVGRVTPGSLEGIEPEARRRLDVLGDEGRTIVLVSRRDEPIAVLAIADAPRPGTEHVLRRLRRLGIRDITMLTGDRAAVARTIGERLDIDHVHADLLPEDKLRIIERIASERVVAMIGDGVNDAPALARAHVGIAIGAAGADVAMETADVVLMGSDLHRLPESVAISRFARRIITQNLALALAVIAVVAPLGLAGVTTLGLAVLLHEGSTVVVVLNALRLLRFRAGPVVHGAADAPAVRPAWAGCETCPVACADAPRRA